MIKNTASQKVGAQMVAATDGSAFTGAVTVAVTLDAGTQATGTVGSGACVHEGNGYHTYAPSQAETNGDLAAFTFTGSGAVPQTVQVYPRESTASLATTFAEALLKLDWTTVTGEAARSVLNALRFLRNKWTLTSTTLSVKKEDDSTEAWSGTVSTDAAAVPIVGNDPA